MRDGLRCLPAAGNLSGESIGSDFGRVFEDNLAIRRDGDGDVRPFDVSACFRRGIALRVALIHVVIAR